jgi:hypothetical protein
VSILLLTLVMAMVGTHAYAQGAATTTSLAGIVADTSGGVIPGADVVIKNNATSAATQATTDAAGRFTIPALDPGTYTMTVSLMGFKTWSSPDVKLIAATPASVKVTLEVGKLEETVVVHGAAEIVQTQSASVTTTMTTTQITNIPLVTRNTLDAVTMLPGVQTTGTARSSFVMGLAANAVNITIDGINTQDNYLKTSDGFFSRISPRMDAVEEVTVSTATPGAESAGQGAVQIRFVTRSGTNQFQGSVYDYMRRPNWNSNYYFNKVQGLPADNVKVDTYGVRVGGPIDIPHLFDGHDKAFFFFNYEEFRQPSQIMRQRTILSTQAQTGLFQYGTAGNLKTVDLMALAAKNGQVATYDPTIQKLLQDIRNSTATTGSLTNLSDPNVQRFSFQNNSTGLRRYPTTRIDVNVTPRNRVGVSFYWQQYVSSPDILNSDDAAFPGFPATGGQVSNRWSVTGNWRTTLTSSLVNEARVGATGGPIKFRPEITPGVFGGTSVGDQGGFGLGISAADSISTVYNSRLPSRRDAPTKFVEDTLSWIKGAHSVTMGGSYTQIAMDLWSQYQVPSISMGVDPSDPAYGLFSTTNFPGASSTDLTRARGIYAVLTGRVTAVNGTAVVDPSTGNYVYLGAGEPTAHMGDAGFFLQDSWRAKPNLTLTYGVRYELQTPFVADSAYYSTLTDPSMLYGISGQGNMFQPGANAGQVPTLSAYTKGTQSYHTDWNNFAPSVGAAWKPTVKASWLQKLVGSDPVLRAGYSLAYLREGMETFDNIFGYNPGGSITATRSMTLGNLVSNASQLPVLFRNPSNLGPPSFATSPAYPITPGYTDSVNLFDPNTTVPYTHSFQAGFQRALNKNTAIEIRYVGTRLRDGWVNGGRNYNEVNILENGFLNEFKLAQANLLANQAAGKGNTFAYTGAGTNPLPIMMAYLQGLNASAATSAANYTSSQWKSSSFVNYLSPNYPLPRSMVTNTNSTGLVDSATWRNNAIAAGLPANEFVVNPTVGSGGAYMTTNETFRNYDSAQFELRRRMSAGLLVQGSYVYAIGQTYNLYSFRAPGELIYSNASPKHTFKLNWVYELPFGQGKAFGNGVSRGWNRLVGGWSFDGSGRIQSGQILDFGNVRLVGMTDTDLNNMFQIRIDPATQKVYNLPQDVIDNTLRAFNVDATSATGYSSLGVPTGRYIAPAGGPDCVQDIAGDCAPRHHYVTGPAFVRFDMSLAKRIMMTSRVNMELRAEALNVFDNINFTPNTYVGPTNTSYEITSAYRDTSNTQDPGGRLLQLSWRLSW